MRTPGTFQRLGSASWGSFGGSIQSTARSGSGSGSSSSLSSVLLQQPSRLSVVTAAQRRGESGHLLFGDSSMQVRAPVLRAVRLLSLASAVQQQQHASAGPCT